MGWERPPKMWQQVAPPQITCTSSSKQSIFLSSPGLSLTQRLHTAFPAAPWPRRSSGELSCLLQLSRNQCECCRLPRKRDVLSHRTHQLHKYGHSAEPLQPLGRERRMEELQPRLTLSALCPGLAVSKAELGQFFLFRGYLLMLLSINKYTCINLYINIKENKYLKDH